VLNGFNPLAMVPVVLVFFYGGSWQLTAPVARVHAEGLVDGSIQYQSAGLNLVLLTPLWTRTAHVMLLRMVRCRFPKLRYG